MQVTSGAAPRWRARVDRDRSLPRRDGYLDVSLRRGRGLVYVVQQPSRVNGYTAILRIRDTQASFGWYDFDVIWR